MPYTTRELPVEEWGRLATLPLAKHTLDPDSAAIVVVEDQGEIVATAGVLTIPHADEFWIDPKYHANPVVVMGLLEGVFALLRAQGLSQVCSVAPSPAVAQFLERLGGVPLGMLYLIPVPESEHALEIH